MPTRILQASAWLGILLAAASPAVAQSERTVRVELSYRAPGNGPQPNFSPYGTQVNLIDLPDGTAIPVGSVRPARTGTMQVGPDRQSWIRILATADPEHPQDLCRLYIDRNRDGDFTNDGPPLTANLSMNAKTKAWWSSIDKVELSIPYGAGIVEPYLVNFWSVREGADAPAIIRYSVGSWRSGSVTVDGHEALVAAMDANNDAVFNAQDKWSVLAASEPDAAKRVLSSNEARPTNRFMFLATGAGKDLVLEFRAISPDGKSMTFAIVDRPVTKADDRAPDDSLAGERSRPRTNQQFPWITSKLDQAMAQATQSQRKVIVDFWTSWCGPCHQLDDWVWTDQEVAALLNAGYVGLKLDGDLEKDFVKRFHVEGYPTILLLDPSGKELKRTHYLPSKEMLDFLKSPQP